MRLTRKGLATAATLAAITTILGCGGSGGPDGAACKSAMQAQYAKALASPSASPASEPAACKGIPAPTLSKYAAQIIASATPSPQG